MALTIDQMRAKMTSVFTGAPAEVIPLQESAPASSSSAVESLRAQLLGKMALAPAPKVTESVQSTAGAKSHQELLEEVINNQIRAVKEESAERDVLRERVGSSRLDLIGSIL